MEKLTLQTIGTLIVENDEMSIAIKKEFIPALQGLEEFHYIQVLWWFDGCDNPTDRAIYTIEKPYTNGPDLMGTFATRSPERPNPIALSCCGVTYVDLDNGIIGLEYIDARNGSPVLDIKPYTPSIDRVEKVSMPDWCAHWSSCYEDSGDFDWEKEFNF